MLKAEVQFKGALLTAASQAGYELKLFAEILTWNSPYETEFPSAPISVPLGALGLHEPFSYLVTHDIIAA